MASFQDVLGKPIPKCQLAGRWQWKQPEL